jgi:hypothetical protein
MSSRIQPFDTVGNRLIDDDPHLVVTSWNGLTGDVKGTLAEIFAFGMGDDPTGDNFFAMPQGNLRFRSTPAGGAFTLGPMSFFETPAALAIDGRVGTWLNRRTQRPAEQGTTFGPVDTVYNAGYSGTLIDGTTWGAQLGLMTSDTDETHQVGDEFWAQTYSGANFFFNAPLSLPSPGGGQSGSVVYLNDVLYAVTNVGGGVRQARQISGFGQEVVYPRGQINGVTPGYIACWTGADIAGPYEAGDGTGLWLAFGDPSHLNDNSPRAIFEAHMLQGNPGLYWGTGIWSWDPAVGGGTPYQIAELDEFVGLQLYRGGLVLPARDIGTETVSPALSAKIVWNDVAQKVQISVDGAAFVNLSTFS